MFIKVNRIGQRFGRFVIVGRDGRKWIALCDCGNKRALQIHNLLHSLQFSCGCWKREKESAFNHESETAEYRSWAGMINRCYSKANKQYLDWGGRGITVCERWRSSYENFLADMGRRPAGLSLDRINNDGNYEPGNCRWATSVQQMRNSRSNRILEIGGIRRCVSEWSEISRTPANRIFIRLRRGWLAEDAVFAPLQPNWRKFNGTKNKRRGKNNEPVCNA